MISRNKSHVDEVIKLFDTHKILAHEKKKVGLWNLEYYFVVLEN